MKFLKRGLCKQNDIWGRYVGQKSREKGQCRGSAITQETGKEDLAHSKSPESFRRQGQAARLSKPGNQGNVCPEWNGDAWRSCSLREHLSQPSLLLGEETATRGPEEVTLLSTRSRHVTMLEPYDLSPVTP